MLQYGGVTACDDGAYLRVWSRLVPFDQMNGRTGIGPSGIGPSFDCQNGYLGLDGRATQMLLSGFSVALLTDDA